MSRWSSNAGGWAKKTRLAEQQRGHRAEPPHRVLPSYQRRIEPARRGRRNLFPECAKSCDAILRRVSRDYGRVNRSNRDAGDPIRLVTVFRHCLVNTGLIRAECTAALQNQSDLLVVFALRDTSRGFLVHDLGSLECSVTRRALNGAPGQGSLFAPHGTVSRRKRLMMPLTAVWSSVQE